MFLCHLVSWLCVHIQVKYYGDHPRGNPQSEERGLNARGIAKYGYFGPIECYISEKVQPECCITDVGHCMSAN